jgi:glucose-6-phosphate isomerase, archaeal
MIPSFPHARLNLDTGAIEGAPVVARKLSDLPGVFADENAYKAALADSDPVIYTVSSVEAAEGEGQMHYGLGVLMPGKVGAEYYMTKGHLHAWRPAAEVYVGLRGEGCMLLQEEATGAVQVVPFGRDLVVYVPGYCAHRTINTGREPLVYVGIYPSNAGHDYGAIAVSNFTKIVIERDGLPVAIERHKYDLRD